MKIGILEPYIEGIGGAQKVIAKYTNYLREKGHQIEILTTRYNPNTCYPEFKKIPIKLIGSKSKFLSPMAFNREFRGFDILIANDWPSNFASLKNDNVIWICYTPKRDFYDLKDYYFNLAGFKEKVILNLKQIFFQSVDIKSAKLMKQILPISETVRKRVKQSYGISCKNLFYCGIDFNKYKSKKSKDYFLSVARFVKPKRIELIIEAMKYVKTNIWLFIVGNGPDKEKIINLCNQAENVKFLGNVSESKLKELYAECLGLIYIPVNEDWGLIPLEAAASEKPIIASNEGGLRETIINNKTGILIDQLSSENIAEKIDLLEINKKLALKLGKQAKINCKKYDWSRLLPKFEEIIFKNIKYK